MSLPHLGETRSARQRDHLLQTPDTFVRAPLPGMRRATAIMHASPALGAAFAEYTAELEPDGQLGEAIGQRFLYILDGEVRIEQTILTPGDYAFIPECDGRPVKSESASRIVVIEKRYQTLHGVNPPSFLADRESEVSAEPLADDGSLVVRRLIPDRAGHDFAINTMTYLPGASLSMVEVHVMEHGLMMLEGGGIYRLSNSWYSVSAGDFIWMAPYCPQWFGAIGRSPAKYLIYKDSNRHPL